MNLKQSISEVIANSKSNKIPFEETASLVIDLLEKFDIQIKNHDPASSTAIYEYLEKSQNHLQPDLITFGILAVIQLSGLQILEKGYLSDDPETRLCVIKCIMDLEA